MILDCGRKPTQAWEERINPTDHLGGDTIMSPSDNIMITGAASQSQSFTSKDEARFNICLSASNRLPTSGIRAL